MDHDRRIEPGELRDERQEPVPEREGVAGMEAAVGELVHRAQVQVGEVEELADAALVEERVADDRALDVPERDSEHRPAHEHAGRGSARSAPASPRPERGTRRRRTPLDAPTSAATSPIAPRIETASEIVP